MRAISLYQVTSAGKAESLGPGMRNPEANRWPKSPEWKFLELL
jgi:hypothetical protein